METEVCPWAKPPRKRRGARCAVSDGRLIRMDEALSFLEDEGLSPGLLRDLKTFRAAHPAPVAFVSRIPAPRYRYYGRRVWEQALTALLCGENLLLSGGKATGKNVLAENLAMVFGRPAWNVSLHVNTDAYGLMGTDTLRGGEVSFRPGPVWLCAAHGGFCILDEVNMARNEALAVLHAALDHRRALDVPGYERLPLCEETRFIGTMNYGYAGTQRGADLSLCGAPYAYDLRGELDAAAAPRVSHAAPSRRRDFDQPVLRS